MKKQTPAGGAKAAETPASTTTPPATETPPAETPAVETPAKPPAPTPEELNKAADEMVTFLSRPVNSFVNAKIKEDQAKADREPKPEPEPAAEDLPQSDAPEGGEKKEGETPTEKQEPEKPTETPAADRFVPGAMTPEQIQATAREAAREEIQSREPEPAPEVPHGTPTSDEAGLSDEAQDHLMVIKKMAAINPAFKDLPERQKKFWKAEEQHRARWEQANPGQPFDPNAAEHAAFYQKNEPFIPKKDFKAAERAIIVDEAEEKATARMRKEQEPRLREMELKEREREVAPKIYESMADSAEEVFSVVPQFKETFEPKKLSKAAIQKMEEINPPLAKIAQEEADRTAIKFREIDRLDHGLTGVDYSKTHQFKNGQVFMPHVEIEKDYGDAEAELLKKGERNGKKLISVASRDQRAVLSIGRTFETMQPEQQERAYKKAVAELSKTFDWIQPADTKAHILAKSKARVGEFAQSFAKMKAPPEKSGASHGQQQNGAPTNGKPAATPSKPNGKAGLARGTSTASASDVADNARKAPSEVEKTTEFLVNRYKR